MICILLLRTQFFHGKSVKLLLAVPQSKQCTVLGIGQCRMMLGKWSKCPARNASGILSLICKWRGNVAITMTSLYPFQKDVSPQDVIKNIAKEPLMTVAQGFQLFEMGSRK